MNNISFGTIKNRDDVEVDVDAVIKRIDDKYEINIGCEMLLRPKLKKIFLTNTYNEKIIYALFIIVSNLHYNKCDTRNNFLGNHEHIRDRLIIENVEFMLDTLHHTFNGTEHTN